VVHDDSIRAAAIVRRTTFIFIFKVKKE